MNMNMDEIRKRIKGTTLDLSGMYLTELPDEIGELNELTTLWLGFNQFTTLPAVIGKLKRLTKLDVSDNQLAKLPRSRYLHLAEAAPGQHPAGLSAGLNEAGQILAALVIAFIQGKQHQAIAL